MSEIFSTPVVLIAFKRLETTRRVVEAIRTVRPKNFFIIADGWRTEEEKAECLRVRSYIESSVDWPCAIRTNYSEQNLGTKKRIVSGLDWVFAQVEEAIILEDDTVPHPTFFSFCKELLEWYRNESKVMQIAGLNIQGKNKKFDAQGTSYYFSQFPEIWGWATWKRAWDLFDPEMKGWPTAKKNNLLSKRLTDPAAIDYWEHLFDYIYAAKDDRKKSDVWAAQWVFAHLLHDGYSIEPSHNLISNIGTGAGATRAKKSKGDNIINLPVVPMKFPLMHPPEIKPNTEADRYTLQEGFKIKSRMREKILFFFKQKVPILHTMIKRLKN